MRDTPVVPYVSQDFKSRGACSTIQLMATGRSQIQVDASQAVRNRAKAVAYGRGLSLTALVLKALANVGDKELKALIEKDLKERAQRGRPQN